MPIITQWRSVAHRNPIPPFAWEAIYYGGTRIKQFPRGTLPWFSLFDLRAVSHLKKANPTQYALFAAGEIVFASLLDRTRLEKLLIHGHRYSPLELPVPFAQTQQPLDEIIIKRTIDMHLPGPGNSQLTHSLRWFFGYRYGAQLYLLEIDEHGNLYRTNTDRGQGTGATDIILKGGPLL